VDDLNMDDGNGHARAWSGVAYGVVAMVLCVIVGFLLAHPPPMDSAIFGMGGLLFIASGLYMAIARPVGRSIRLGPR
jgi:hypothetical protein